MKEAVEEDGSGALSGRRKRSTGIKEPLRQMEKF